MRQKNRLVTAGLAAVLLLEGAQIAVADDNGVVDEVVVTSQRRAQPLLEHAGNIARIDSELLQQINHQHIHELLTRVSSVWVSRGSGQEHLTAIR